VGFRDRIYSAGGIIASVAGDAMLGVAEGLHKAGKGAGPDLDDTTDEGPERAPGGDKADTPKSAPVPTDEAKKDPDSLFWDPYAIVEQLGYKERASNVTYGTLKAMVWKVPIVQAIIQTRINQISSFAVPQRDRYQLGFRVKLRESDKAPSTKDKKWSQQMENLLLRTGVTDDPRGRDSFETFLRKIAFDTLAFDQLTFEICRNAKGQPAAWYATDASTYRLADSASTYAKQAAGGTKNVQIYAGMIIGEFDHDSLCFAVRNPRTDIRLFGYGTSELEMMISTVTSLLWALDYNKKAFSQGSAHKGVLNFKGAIPDKQLRAFRRHWHQMLSGVENAWRTPITNADELQWISMHSNNSDMEYNAYVDFLIKVTCSMYAMDPVEVNFKYGNSGGGSTMQEASNKEKITESKERGLRPLLRFISDQINRNIIWPISEDFEFEFVGLDAMTRNDLAKLNAQRVKTTWTVDELRAEDDKPPLPDGLGAVLLDPTWAQYYQGKQAEEQGEEGGFGEEGEEGEGPEDEDEESAFMRQFGESGDDGDDDEPGGGKAEEKANPAQRNGGLNGKKNGKPFGKSRTVVVDLEL